jgi:hypothetical protein
MFEQFAAAVDEAARTGAAPATVAGPGPLRIAAGAALDPLRRASGRLRAAVRRWLRGRRRNR